MQGIVDSVLPCAPARFFFGYVRRRWSPEPAGEGGQPVSHGRRIVIHYVVNARVGLESGYRRARGVFHVHEGEDSGSSADNGIFLLLHLSCDASVYRILVGSWTTEEAIAHRDSSQTRPIDYALFNLGISSYAAGDSWRRMNGEGFRFRCKAIAWRIKESGRLHNVTLRSAGTRGVIYIATPFDAQFAIFFRRCAHRRGRVFSRQRSEFIDDGIRPELAESAGHGFEFEYISDCSLGALLPQSVGASRSSSQAENLVTFPD